MNGEHNQINRLNEVSFDDLSANGLNQRFLNEICTRTVRLLYLIDSVHMHRDVD